MWSPSDARFPFPPWRFRLATCLVALLAVPTAGVQESAGPQQEGPDAQGASDAQESKGGDGSPEASSHVSATWNTVLDLEWASEGDRSQKLQLDLEPSLEAWLGSKWRLFAEARLRTDRYDRLEPLRPSDPTSSGASRRLFLGDRSEAELREFYVERAFGSHRMVLGKQQVVWGQADGFKVLDVVNPQDFREWILEDFEDSRIPVWMAKMEFSLGRSQLQLLAIPDATHHRFVGSRALFSAIDLAAFGEELELKVETQDDSDERVELGARWSGFLGRWDVSLNYLWHSVDTPLVDLQLGEATAPLAELTYPWTHLVGATLSNAFGPMTVRTEVAYESDRDFQGLFLRAFPGDPLERRRGSETSAVLGLDFSFAGGRQFLSGQWFGRWRDLESERTGAAVPDSDRFATLVYRTSSRGRRFRTETQWLVGLDESEGLVRLTLTAEIVPDLELRVGGDAFYGDATGLLGRFDARDRFRVGVRTAF